MANLSWNEIKNRALDFQKRWQNEKRENAEKQTFYNEFFEVFGLSRRRFMSFEKPVKKLNNRQGFIDLFWKGVLIVEHKSLGKNLEEAKAQAFEYFEGLKEGELPRYILVSDFNNFELFDLDENQEYKFEFKDFYKNIKLFGFIAGYQKRVYKDLEPANIKASELMGKLYDKLAKNNYKQHDLELFLVRVLFCLFADDTGIFKNEDFKYLIEDKTKEDGSDTGIWLHQLFEVLDTKIEYRQTNLDETLKEFPYINGSLFENTVRIPSFDKDMRNALLECCYFDWSNISPAIFGSLFQCVADKEKRRSFGEHYTSENNIMKTISALFLDELREEFEKIKTNKNKLREFHQKISKLKFLDPACGCGNFLIIAYREIRQLEIDILTELYKEDLQDGILSIDISNLSLIDVDNFYGIEINEFPAKIAEVALWLMDHLMNLKLSIKFGMAFERIPLKKSAVIKNENALIIDWKNIIDVKELSYILGNPPFVGARMKSKEQSEEMKKVFNNMKGYGDLDYVSAWYKKSAELIKGTKIKIAFVSTNSITQGTQVSILWENLIKECGVHIHFAHRTFEWNNEAKGKAHVYCVIIGFANFNIDKKRLFDYEDIKGEPHEIIVENINPYLIDFENVFIGSRNKSISEIPNIGIGNKPIDDGNYLFKENEMIEFIKNEPNSEKYFYKWTGAKLFINNETDYVLLASKIPPNELKKMPLVMERIKNVKEFREKSSSKPTRDIAKYPTKFHIENFPENNYLLIPRVSSERRIYIPIGFMDKNTIAGDSCLIVQNAELYHFGVLTSIMHMVWVKYVCGRLKSDYRYSKDIVYNNFPWPLELSEDIRTSIEIRAKGVLSARAQFPDSSLADLYDPLTMPKALIDAHNKLDLEVDKAYGVKKNELKNESERIKFLFKMYEKYIDNL